MSVWIWKSILEGKPINKKSANSNDHFDCWPVLWYFREVAWIFEFLVVSWILCCLAERGSGQSNLGGETGSRSESLWRENEPPPPPPSLGNRTSASVDSISDSDWGGSSQMQPFARFFRSSNPWSKSKKACNARCWNGGHSGQVEARKPNYGKWLNLGLASFLRSGHIILSFYETVP